MPIHQLFPEPIYFATLERELTKGELKEINKQKTLTYKNVGNITSKDTYVLNNKALKNLKKDLYTKVMDYFDKVICTDNSITPYITQSWLNYTKTNEFHHMHQHPNSFVSGVFYVAADDKVDKIVFRKPPVGPDKQIKLGIAKYNTFNSQTWFYMVKTGDIVLFPSHLSHGVDKKKETNTRISLSFNVFFKGTIGNKIQLTELVLS
jgi:uncharacterized protein (TIGR02466 family)|tara:strand:+ start:48 stop:665 length:618 start_codon:yes stop_codon:yes gene_type:complete